MTTIRSPRRISSPPPGRMVSSSRMIAAIFESSGRRASRSGTPTTSAVASSSTANSPTWTWPSAKTSVWRAAGTPRMRLIAYDGLELLGHDEVDVELTLPPQVDVLDARRADHRRRPGRLAPREHPRHEVHLVARRAGDDEVGAADPGVREVLPAGPVSLVHGDVEPARQRLQTRGLGVDHRDLVLLVERLDDRGADLARADEEDPHGHVAYFRPRPAHSRRLP